MPPTRMLEAVARGASLQDLRSLTDRDCHKTMLDDGIEKLKAGDIDLRALLAIVSQCMTEDTGSSTDSDARAA